MLAIIRSEGSSALDLVWAGLSMTFEGHFLLKFADFVVAGRFVGHGGGDFEGMKKVLDFTEVMPGGPSIKLEGHILNAHP